MDTLREAIETGRRRVSQWPLPRHGERVVRRGLRRSCEAGSKALDDALKARTAEHLHECRKQTKYMYHQVQMLEGVASPAVSQLIEQLHELEANLGDEHDLGMLRVEVVACIAGGLPDVNDRLVALIDGWRKELQQDCLGKAQEIYHGDSAALQHHFRDCAKRVSAKKH
jgi:CHAD domain-containing protein